MDKNGILPGDGGGGGPSNYGHNIEMVRQVIAPRILNHDGKLNEHELKLLHCSAEGDLQGLRDLFEQRAYYLYHIDVNCADSLDRTSLSLATINGHADVVNYLLNEDENLGVQLGDSLFYAIQTESIEIIELLLEKDPQTSLQVQPGTTSPFEPGLTPFMLAAHKNNYRILALLYKYSHRLTFSDNELMLNESFDPYSWDAVTERLLHYRARASPAFMLLMFNEKGMAWDPLNACMDLYGELRELARREREVDESYLKMSETCETFAIQLLEEVRASHELADLMRYDLDDSADDEIVVNNNGTEVPRRRQAIRNYLKPIEKAVKYEMKDFVTSDNSQLALIYIQKGALFRRLKGTKAFLAQVFMGLLFPILTLAHLVAPNCAMGRLLKNPTVKFWCWVMSEVIFIILLLANTILMQFGVIRIDVVSPLLAIAYSWIVGKFCQEVREIYYQGLVEYLSDVWNWNDVFTIFLYTGYILLRLIHWFTKGVTGDTAGGNHIRYETQFGTLSLSDICISFSYILIHIRILEILRAQRTFGPLQVSFDLMIHDAVRFFVIFCIVFLAFGSGITELYTPYGSDQRCSCNSTDVCNPDLPMVQVWDNSTGWNNTACVMCKNDGGHSQSMTKLLWAFQGLVWTLFGYGEPRTWYTIENCPEKYYLQEAVGAIIIGGYHIIAIIVLVNMLIAMMSNSFQKTHDDSEREWKFHRTQLWLKFIRNEINLIPPMNLIPRWALVKSIAQHVVKAFRKVAQCVSPPATRGRSEREVVEVYRSEIAASGGGSAPDTLTRNSFLVHPLRNRSTPPETASSLLGDESRYDRVLRLVVLRYVKKKVLHEEMVI